MSVSPTGRHDDGRAAYERRVQRTVIHLAKTRPYFDADDIARLAPAPESVDARVVGNVLTGLRRDGVIKVLAYERLEVKRAHGRPQARWAASSPDAPGWWLATHPLTPDDAPQTTQLTFQF